MGYIRCQERQWTNPSNAHQLFYRFWEPDLIRGAVVIVHGFGEHGGRYADLAQALAERGLTVACPDLWGHGRSSGQRGDIEHFDQYLDDLETFADQAIVARMPQGPCAAFGHSFGGLVTAQWAIRNPARFRSIILQAPLLGVGFPVPRWKERLAIVLNAWWPRVALPIGLDPAWLSRDVSVVERYRRDPLVHNRMTLRGYAALAQAMRQAFGDVAKLTAPTLLLYGTADRVVSLKACQEFFEALVCEKRLVSFPDCYHELHHEPACSKVLEELVRWVHAHA